MTYADILSTIYLTMVSIQCSLAATHWVVTEDGKLHTQDDSVFTLRRPYDLVSLLEQEKRAEQLKKIKNDLIAQKQAIEASSTQAASAHTLDETELGTNTIVIDGETDIESVVYQSSDDCNKAGKPLPEFDLYVGTVLFLPPKALADDDDAAFEHLDDILKNDDRLT